MQISVQSTFPLLYIIYIENVNYLITELAFYLF